MNGPTRTKKTRLKDLIGLPKRILLYGNMGGELSGKARIEVAMSLVEVGAARARPRELSAQPALE